MYGSAHYDLSTTPELEKALRSTPKMIREMGIRETHLVLLSSNLIFSPFQNPCSGMGPSEDYTLTYFSIIYSTLFTTSLILLRLSVFASTLADKPLHCFNQS